MQTLRTQQLQRLMDHKQDYVLVDVLPEADFEREHIPGSINVPATAPDLIDRIAEAANGKSRMIVVYCTDPQCNASPSVGKRLEQAGYDNVAHYEDGIEGWKAAGLPIEGEQAPAGRAG